MGNNLGTQPVNNGEKVRLAYAKGNPQSEAFWTKNGFLKTGLEIPNDFSSYIIMEKELEIKR